MKKEPGEDEDIATTHMKPPTEQTDSLLGDQSLSLTNRLFSSRNGVEKNSYLGDNISFRPQYFFFYGSLMDPRHLARVLRLSDPPIPQPARITNWDTMMWGRYPALVFKPNSVTHGMAFEVRKEEHVRHLKHHETEVYTIKECIIEMADGRKVCGKTFVWDAGKEVSKEGKFDLKDWQMEQVEM